VTLSGHKIEGCSLSLSLSLLLPLKSPAVSSQLSEVEIDLLQSSGKQAWPSIIAALHLMALSQHASG